MLSSGICHASLVFLYTDEPLDDVYTKKIQGTSGTFHGISRESIANYFIPCLNLRKIYGNFKHFGKSSEISGNFQKHFGNSSNPFLRSLNDL